MKRVLLMTAWALGGFVVGYFVGVFYACSGEDASNLCGLLGVFVTGPIGSIAGVVLGRRMLRRRQ
jgi:hypothetical protein